MASNNKKDLERQQAEMRERNRVHQRAHRAKVQQASLVEGTVLSVLEKLQSAMNDMEGLTPDEVNARITGLTALLRIKLNLQVNACLDHLNHSEPAIRQDALNMMEALMPYVTQLQELDVKLIVALGLQEGKGKLTGPQKRQIAAPASNQSDWENKFGDTLQNKSLN